MRKVMIVGANSAIAAATARLFAEQGDQLVLVGRNAERLEQQAADLRIRGAQAVFVQVMDANAFEQHQQMIDRSWQQLGGLDTALIAHGTLSDQRQCEQSFEAFRREFETNALSAISLLTELANRFERQGHGSLAVISSVAGDRGRQSNYAYGTAKAALSTFLSGLRNRLSKQGIQVLTIKPGFVDTPMTAEFKKGVLWAKPETIARGIVKALEQRRDVAYLPGFWWLIMTIIKMIPEKVFKRLSL